MKRTIEIAGKESMIIDADGKDASNHFSEGFPNQKPGSDYEYFSCGFQVGLNAPRHKPDPAINKWIEELETNFKFNNHTQGDLVEYGPSGKESILYQVPSEGIYIDRIVTIPQMEALLSHMKKHQVK